jgi:hypothetical protein
VEESGTDGFLDGGGVRDCDVEFGGGCGEDVVVGDRAGCCRFCYVSRRLVLVAWGCGGEGECLLSGSKPQQRGRALRMPSSVVVSYLLSLRRGSGETDRV